MLAENLEGGSRISLTSKFIGSHYQGGTRANRYKDCTVD
jgi:hypothetical protein